MKSYNGFTPAQRYAGDRIIKAAIAAGTVKPAEALPCALCGKEHGKAGGIMHYHAEDYRPDRILADMKPLCWTCHMMLHGRFHAPKSWERFKAGVADGSVVTHPVWRHDWRVLDEYTLPEERRRT